MKQLETANSKMEPKKEHGEKKESELKEEPESKKSSEPKESPTSKQGMDIKEASEIAKKKLADVLNKKANSTISISSVWIF